jgi:sugar phosphate isomerase/epimerase
MQRRTFIKASSLTLAGMGGMPLISYPQRPSQHSFGCTLALNAYSFNTLLLEERMTLDELFRFARSTGFSAVDLTAYYIPGYPEVPWDKALFGIRKKAFLLGLAISGTGVRNDFTLSDPDALSEQIRLVKDWIRAAAMLGAPHVRVFAGRGPGTGEPRETVKQRIIGALQECAGYAGNFGVMIAFQNHYDYIQSTSETLEILQSVDSEWFGLMLDIGSVEGPDPYQGIEKLLPHAITWQVKEHVRSAEGNIPTDVEKLMKLVNQYGYQGYFPLETLGEGDPYEKVKKLFERVAGLTA